MNQSTPVAQIPSGIVPIGGTVRGNQVYWDQAYGEPPNCT